MSEQLKNKIVNPEAHFDKPKDVVQDDALSHKATKGCPGAMRANERRKPIVSMKLFKRKIRSAKSQSTSHLIKR